MPNDELNAFHEAGHAIAAHQLGVEIIEVTIEKHGELAARTSTNNARYKARNSDHEMLRKAITADILVTLAGPAAKYRHTPVTPIDDGWHKDVLDAEDLIARIAPLCHGELEAMVAKLCRAAEGIVETNWPAIVKVAGTLLARRTITGGELRELLDNGLT